MNAIYMDEKETVDEPESVLLQIKRHIAGVLRHGGESLLSVPLDKIVVHRLNIHETAANRVGRFLCLCYCFANQQWALRNTSIGPILLASEARIHAKSSQKHTRNISRCQAPFFSADNACSTRRIQSRHRYRQQRHKRCNRLLLAAVENPGAAIHQSQVPHRRILQYSPCRRV